MFQQPFSPPFMKPFPGAIVSTGPFLGISALRFRINASNVDTLFQDISLATPAVSDNAVVQGWKDLSGYGLNALQSVTSKSPVLKTNVVNGKNVVRFDGIDDVLSVGTTSSFNFLHDGTGGSIAIIFKRIAGSSDGMLFINNGGTTGQTGVYIDHFESKVYHVITKSVGGSAVINSFVSFTNGSFGVYIARYKTQTGVDFRHRKGGSSDTTANESYAPPASGNASQVATIGGSVSANAYFGNIDLCEMFAHATEYTDTDIANILSYATATWGT